MDRLRKDDFIYMYWVILPANRDIRPASTFWLVRRQDELIFQGIYNNTDYFWTHFPYRSVDQVEAIQRAIGAMGLREIPVYTDYNRMSVEYRTFLKGQFDIFDEMSAKREEELARLKEKKAQLQDKPVKEGKDESIAN